MRAVWCVDCGRQSLRRGSRAVRHVSMDASRVGVYAGVRTAVQGFTVHLGGSYASQRSKKPMPTTT